jgi:hypothetical protein
LQGGGVRHQPGESVTGLEAVTKQLYVVVCVVDSVISTHHTNSVCA